MKKTLLTDENINQIKKYKELLNLNIITQEDFDKIKKELLHI